jgi:hypothetical protein
VETPVKFMSSERDHVNGFSSDELPRWKCHKEVRAVKIIAVAGDMIIPLQGYAPFEVPPDWLKRHEPVPGGYYVVYADQYSSYSPPEAFESGYTQLSNDWRDRVVEEKRELDEKVQKLSAFLEEISEWSARPRMTQKQLDLLHAQLSYMKVYSEILTERLQENV